MRSEPISSSLFVRNRAKLLARLEPGDVALVCSGEEVIRSGDQFYPYRPHSDFFYLAGISRPGSVLVLAADCEILFIRKADEQTLQWSGSQLSREQASELSGIREVRWLVEMPGDLKKLSGEYECILHNGPAQGIMEEHVPGKAGNSLSGHMQSLRMIKEP